MVECDICRNKDVYCKICCHHYEDYFAPLSNDEIEEIEREEFRMKILETLRPEKIQISVPEKFREAFNSVRQFCSSEDVRFAPVQTLDEALMATDNHVLCYFPCEVPPELRGKGIIAIQDDFAETCSPGEWPSHEYIQNNLLNLDKYSCVCNGVPIAGTKQQGSVIAVEIALPGRIVFVKKQYLDAIAEVVDLKKVKVFYNLSGRDPLLLESRDGVKIAVMPLKMGEGG